MGRERERERERVSKGFVLSACFDDDGDDGGDGGDDNDDCDVNDGDVDDCDDDGITSRMNNKQDSYRQ